MQVVYIILLLIGIAATLHTFYLYTSGNKGWFKSEIGQLLLSMSGIVLFFELWYLFVALFPDVSQEARAYVRLGLFVILTVVIVARDVIMSRLRLLARSEKNERAKESESD